MKTSMQDSLDILSNGLHQFDNFRQNLFTKYAQKERCSELYRHWFEHEIVEEDRKLAT